jgi:hypothetical protein
MPDREDIAAAAEAARSVDVFEPMEPQAIAGMQQPDQAIDDGQQDDFQR